MESLWNVLKLRRSLKQDQSEIPSSTCFTNSGPLCSGMMTSVKSKSTAGSDAAIILSAPLPSSAHNKTYPCSAQNCSEGRKGRAGQYGSLISALSAFLIFL